MTGDAMIREIAETTKEASRVAHLPQDRCRGCQGALIFRTVYTSSVYESLNEVVCFNCGRRGPQQPENTSMYGPVSPDAGHRERKKILPPKPPKEPRFAYRKKKHGSINCRAAYMREYYKKKREGINKARREYYKYKKQHEEASL